MNILNLLKGKKINIMTDAKVIVQLEIESIDVHHHSEDLEPSTRKNDWWPKSRNWTTYDVKFTNGFKKSYDNISDIDIIS